MLILAINTASSQTAIALLQKAAKIAKFQKSIKILAEKSWPAKNNEAEKLMPQIARQFQKIKKNYHDLSQVIVIKGPGSFTGLRVGVTVANTIACLTGCKLYAINTFEYWHALNNLPVVIYAGSGGVYFSESLKKKPQLINLEKISTILEAKKIKKISGDLSKEQKSLLKNFKFITSKKTPGQVIQKILLRKNLKPVKIVEPLYIKEPAITQSKKPF